MEFKKRCSKGTIAESIITKTLQNVKKGSIYKYKTKKNCFIKRETGQVNFLLLKISKLLEKNACNRPQNMV